MPQEIEAKFRLTGSSEPADFLMKVIAAGAMDLGSHLEKNYFYDTRNYSIESKGQVLRLRTEISNKGTVYVVTYKGKKNRSKIKTREEIETTVADGDAFRGILEALGYTMFLSFEKYRWMFSLKNCTICIDLLPEIGFFAEIEGPSEDDVRLVQKEIGYEDVELISQGYGKLLVKCDIKNIRKPRIIVFRNKTKD